MVMNFKTDSLRPKKNTWKKAQEKVVEAHLSEIQLCEQIPYAIQRKISAVIQSTKKWNFVSDEP
uniref:Uncharacterized protein n=1 Tax=Solanum tuberosum TaxID=4113 RepID=M1C9L9_SOLTU